MDKRFSFGEDALLYDRYRPQYCNRLIEDILFYSKLERDAKLVEVGIGSGIATKPFLERRFQVKGVDISESMIQYVHEKFKQFDNFSSECCEFEKMKIEDESVDLIFSATAFHWIHEDSGYAAVRRMLKKNGIFALFWNHPFVSREDDALHMAIQGVYQKYEDSLQSKKQIEDDFDKYQYNLNMMKKQGFCDIEIKTYKSKRYFTSDDYIGLLNTYSDHRARSQHDREAFEADIKEAIDKNGAQVIVYDTNVLLLGKKACKSNII